MKKVFSNFGYLAAGHYGGDAMQLSIHKRIEDSVSPLTTKSDVGGYVYSIRFSPDGKYLAAQVNNGADSLVFYRRDGDTFTKIGTAKLPSPSYNGSSSYYGGSFSPDGLYYVATTSTAPWMVWFKFENETFTHLPNPAVTPGEFCFSSAWDAAGNYLAIGSFASGIHVYRRENDTLVKIASPGSKPYGRVYGLAFSPDGTMLTAAIDNSAKAAAWSFQNEVFVKLNPPLGSGTDGSSVNFSPDGTHFALGSYNNGLEIFKVVGQTFIKLASALSHAAGGSAKTSYSQDGNYLAVSSYLGTFLQLFKRNGDGYTRIHATNSLAAKQVQDVALITDYVTVEKNALSFAKVSALPATLEPNTVYMLPGATTGELNWYITDNVGSEVRRAPTSVDAQTMLSQAVATLNEVTVVSDIAARNALSTSSSKTVLVLDASGDPTVASGSATYFLDASTDQFHKVSESESMDLLLSWDTLVNGVLSTALEVDDAVAQRHGHYDLAALNQITVVADQLFFGGNVLNGSIGVAQW